VFVWPLLITTSGRIAWPCKLAACLAFLFPAIAFADSYRVELQTTSELRGLLKEHLDLLRYRERDDIGPEQLDFLLTSAAANVEKLAATEGYFSPKTEASVTETGANPLIRLVVEPGPRTVVRKLDIEVSGPAADGAPQQLSRMRTESPLKQGEPFRQEEWNAAKESGLQILQQRSFAAASIAQSQARILADQNAADLAIRYESGPAFSFGPLQVKGTRRYPESIIRNVDPLHVGEEYSTDRLLELQRQVQKTGYFSNVVVDIEKDPAKAERSPVMVQVNEFPTQRVRGNVGYTTDTGIRVDGLYTHLNTFDRAWVLTTQASVEQRRQSTAIDLAMPPGPGAWVNSTQASYERTTLEGIDLRSRRIGIRRARSLEKTDTAFSLTYFNDRLEQTDGAPVPADTFIERGTHQALVLGLERTHRNVDDPIYPRKGRIVSYQVGFAFENALSDASFVRTYGRLREFVPIGRRDLVILRAELGGVFTKGGNGDIPASLLFRAGGTDSVRGYPFQGIGNERDGTVFPTRFLATGGAEYVHWLKDDWGGAVFYDAGVATDRWSDRSLFHAVGIGARWRSPVGRVNLDLAYGFQVSKLRPHLSLGIAF
jgi:translocation and assembly module TamA